MPSGCEPLGPNGPLQQCAGRQREVQSGGGTPRGWIWARTQGPALRGAYWIGVPTVVDVSVIAIAAALVKIVPVVFVPKYRMALPAAGTAVAK